MADPGDARALLRENLDVHAREIYLFFRRLGVDASTAEDLRQDALIAAWQSISSLRQTKSIRGWVYGVAYNVYLRHRRQLPPPPCEDAAERLSSGHHPGDEQHLLAQAVRDAVQQLPDRYRQPLVLLYWQGLSYRETAMALSVPMGTLAWRVHGGLRLMRRALSEKGIEDDGIRKKATSDRIADSVRDP